MVYLQDAISQIDKGKRMKTMLKVLLSFVGAAAVVLAAPVLYYFPGYNWRTVEKGAFYGSRQMGGAALERTIKKYGVKTVINLRGENPGSDWYDAEVEACKRTGITLANFGWSKNSIPSPESLAKFIELVESGQGPFLAHCQGGTHRTGAAAACYELLRGKSVTEARKQFGPMFNDAPIGQLVDLYETSNLPFKQWALEVYPGIYEQYKNQKKESCAKTLRLALAFNTT